MSSAIARNIFRMFSACCSSCAVGAELGELGDPVYQLGDLGPELLLDVLQREVGVFRHVVENCRRDGDGIDADIGQNLGRSHGWVMYGSPVKRVWSWWASRAKSKACCRTVRSACG